MLRAPLTPRRHSGGSGTPGQLQGSRTPSPAQGGTLEVPASTWGSPKPGGPQVTLEEQNSVLDPTGWTRGGGNAHPGFPKTFFLQDSHLSLQRDAAVRETEAQPTEPSQLSPRWLSGSGWSHPGCWSGIFWGEKAPFWLSRCRQG